MPFTFAQADEFIQAVDAAFASSESIKFAALTDRLMEVNTLGVGKTAMVQVKEHLIQLGQNSPHQAVLARLLLLIDIHLLEDVHKEGGALMQQALQQHDCNALKLLIDVYGADAEAGLDSDGNNALHFAAKEGYEAATRFLIEECKMAVNKPNSKGHTALHWAAKGGNSQLVAYLLAQGADVTTQARNGEAPLHRAIRGGHTAICKQLIATGKANINAKDVNGGTVLHIAAGIGELELITYLLTCGADATAEDVEGGSPLHEAVRRGSKAVCEKLITVGKADVNAQDDRGLTALHLAVEKGDPELVAYLLACGADVTAQDEDDETPFNIAVYRRHDAICKQLIATVVDINTRGHENRTFLHLVAEAGNSDLVAYLLTRGADVTLEDERGFTPLDFAASQGHRDVFKQLVIAGGAGVVSIKNRFGGTILHAAAELGDLELVAHLLACGADVTAQNRHGDMPFHKAAGKGHKAICEQLVGTGQVDVYAKNLQGDTVLHLAAKGGHAELVRWLVEKFQVNVNDPDNYGNTALHYAAENGNPELMSYLLTKGARITTQMHGDTPLHWAVIYSHKAVCEQLITRGKADVNAKNRYGNTVLHYAAERGNSELVTYLLACGADVTAQDGTGNAPLHLAALKGHKAICEQLIATKKVDIHVKNKLDLTALQWAVKEGNSDLVAYLLASGANVTEPNGEGNTPLHLAALKGHKAICEQLLATKRVDVNAKNSIGRTALHCAAKIGDVELVAYLLAHGANVTAQGGWSVPPLHTAVEQQDIELVKLLLKAGARPNVKTYPADESESEEEDWYRTLVGRGGRTVLEEAKKYPKIRSLLTDFSVIPERAALVRQETLRVLLPLSLHHLLIPSLQNIVAGYMELPEELRAEQKPLTPPTVFVQIELVEQALLAFAQEINNPGLGLTYAARIERLNVSAEKIIATLELPESCIHYWHQLKQQQNQIETDRIAVVIAVIAEVMLTQSPAACAQYLNELIETLNVKEVAILQANALTTVSGKQEVKEKDQKHSAAYNKINNATVEAERELAEAAAMRATARKIIVLGFAERVQYLEALKETLSKSTAAFEAIPRPSQLPDVPPIPTIAVTTNPLIVSTASSTTSTGMSGKQEIKGSEPDESFPIAMEDDGAVSAVWLLSQSSSSSFTSTLQSTASSNKQEVKETKQARSASSSASSSVGKNPSTHFYQPAKGKRVAEEQAEQEHIMKPKNSARRKGKEQRNKSHS